MKDLFEYRREMDALRYTDTQKTQLADRVAKAAAQAEKTAVRRPIRRIVLVAAAMAAVLVVGAGATGVLKSAVEALSPLFGDSAAQTEVIDKIGRPIGASDTQNGVTITADAIIGDAYNAAIVFTITRDDGTALLPEGIDSKTLLMGGFGGANLSIRGGAHGSSWFVDDDPADNTLQMVQIISADVPITNCIATAEFEDLCGWDDEAGESVSLVEGHWEFRFDMTYEDCSVTLGSGETFTQNGMTFTVERISVSPVGVKVDYTVDSQIQWSDAPSGRLPEEDSRAQEKYFESVAIFLTKTDGTVVDLSNSGGSIAPKNGITVCSKSGMLEEILPLEEIESISVGGIVYSIQAD